MMIIVDFIIDKISDARAQLLTGVDYFCRERLLMPADSMAAVLGRIGQSFTDLMAQYRMTGDGHELLVHNLRIMVGNDVVTQV